MAATDDVAGRIEGHLSAASKAKVSSERALGLSSAIDLLLDEGLAHLKAFVPGVLEFMVRSGPKTAQTLRTFTSSVQPGTLLAMLRACAIISSFHYASGSTKNVPDALHRVRSANLSQNDRSAAARVCVVRFIMDLSLRTPLCKYVVHTTRPRVHRTWPSRPVCRHPRFGGNCIPSSLGHGCPVLGTTIGAFWCRASATSQHS